MTLDIALGVACAGHRGFTAPSPPEDPLALHSMAEMQKVGGTVALIDAEHAFGPEYSQRLGLDVDEVVVYPPEAGEMALEVVDTLVAATPWTSSSWTRPALVPRSEIEGEIGMVQVGDTRG